MELSQGSINVSITFFSRALYLPGGANLYVNVSIELTSEKLHSELKKKGSEIFINKTSWIETQVSMITLNHSKNENLTDAVFRTY